MGPNTDSNGAMEYCSSLILEWDGTPYEIPKVDTEKHAQIYKTYGNVHENAREKNAYLNV